MGRAQGRGQDAGRGRAATGPGPGGSAHSQGEAGLAPTRDGRGLFYQRLAGPDAPDGAAAALPTVVFEGGLAAGRSYWAPVQVAVSAFAPAVVYDRSGLGRSAPDPGPRRLDRLARDLGDLLDHLGPGPFLLVGHSWGGPLVRLAAAARPGRIAALVLVDPADESCDLLLRPEMRRQERIGQGVSTLLARIGLLGPAYRSLTAALPADAAADMRAEGYTVAAMRTRGRELEDTRGDLQALLDTPPDLGEIPLLVVSAGRPSIGMPPRVRERATASHAHRAGRSAHGRHVILPDADHMVPATAPDALAREIRTLLAG
ncbi:alpha/beta fold hydrolase [Streptomyces sp. NPDC059917]|uniref:alpha/beta fold hydrolase n=1 Tax=Streptomyces sp. NPDC059917 TaxID=3347002 RepID=UPI00364D6BEE